MPTETNEITFHWFVLNFIALNFSLVMHTSISRNLDAPKKRFDINFSWIWQKLVQKIYLSQFVGNLCEAKTISQEVATRFYAGSIFLKIKCSQWALKPTLEELIDKINSATDFWNTWIDPAKSWRFLVWVQQL